MPSPASWWGWSRSPAAARNALSKTAPCQRRQPERPGQGPVVLEPPAQPPLDPGCGVVGVADLPVGAGEPLQLVPRHRPGDLGQALLVIWRGDPGQCPHLGVGEPGRGEIGADHRQVPQGTGHADMLPGGTGGHLAFPRQPLGAAIHLPARPAAAGVEVGEQDQEPAGGCGQVPGQLADLRFQSLQRYRARGRIAGDRGRGVRDRDGAAGDRARLPYIEHVFDNSARV